MASPDSPPPLPYAHLNLTRNPFGELTTEEWTETALVSIPGLAEWLQAGRRCVQFIGEKGRGKTTHLLALRAQLAGSVYVHFDEDSPPRLPQAGRLLLDEFQRLGRTLRRRAYQTAQTLVLGTHTDFATELTKAGFEVRTIDVPIALTPQWLCELSQGRIERFRRGLGGTPFLTEQVAEQLLARFGSNLRAILGELYDALQRQTEAGPIRIA